MRATSTGDRVYLGFGFGPIQAGLMLLEAMKSGAFRAYTVAEIDADMVRAVRENGNRVTVNVAGKDGIRKQGLEGFRILNPGQAEDAAALIRAVRESDEMATALPSVASYDVGGAVSVAAILAAGLDARKPRVLYTAENGRDAAWHLRSAILRHTTGTRIANLQILNTVIGKMSGVVSDRASMERLGLEPLVPGWGSAILVEEYNRILISRPLGVPRGITVFQEKEDLGPFEEAKLYGHNAAHSVLGYLAAHEGYDVMSRIRGDDRLVAIGLSVFRFEVGPALIHRHGRRGEPLFTAKGWDVYARDLMERMTSPWLNDQVERVCRDPGRKLGAQDRMIGAMTLALEAGVRPTLLALGAAAALRYARRIGEPFARLPPRDALSSLWGSDAPPGDLARDVVELVVDADSGLERIGGQR